jgi:hypothetical protein
MDFKDYLIEEEKKVEKFVVTFVHDADEKEVYTVLASKKDVNDVIAKWPDRYKFLAAGEGVKLCNKGCTAKLYDLNGLRKHVMSEVEEK